jgi:hypoxanthine phosphoribosyltransferase
MSTVKVLDKHFSLFISKQEIQHKVSDLCERINADYIEKEPLFISVLNGSFVFAADLVRGLEIPHRISFIKVKSYDGLNSSGEVMELIGLSESLSDQDVIILEDIVDTGITMEKILTEVNDQHPRSVSIAALLMKPEALQRNIHVDYLGFKIPNNFVVGYGLDYNGFGRNLEGIYKVKN